ncbi:MAG: DDE-type integrase/transposase/recombinase [Xenococcus sp. MO_188.B8]|nr:DDE-type integrase/transposase/recombinase [Xenococcus sp. MO_188.B8]
METQKDSLSPDFMPGILEEPEAKEYKILTELSEEAKLKIDLIEAIRHACDRQTRKEKIEEAAKKLDKSTRTIRRMVTKVEQEGLAALAETVRSDKGQLRTSLEWQDKIIKLYNQKKRLLKKNNKNGNQKIEVNRHQIWKLIEAEARLIGLKEGEFPSHVTVYKVLEPLINKSKLRHPGQGEKQSIQTTDGPLEITHSNQIFQCDHTDSDILLVDTEGNEIGRPYFTTIIDSYSGCIVGYHISLKKPGSHEVALAFRHAFLPKPKEDYSKKFKLQKEWEVSGIPQYFVTDRAKEFKSAHLKQIAAQLGIELRLRAYPQQGGLVERPFGTINTEFLESMPGYTGSNIERRPKNAEKEACFTLEELEQLLVRYVVDNYNQNPYPRAKNQTRVSRWKSMLLAPLKYINERELDICLFKSNECKIQGKGTVRFKTNTYEGDCLRDCHCEYVTLRYDPHNLLRLMVYTKEENGQPARYLGVVLMLYNAL